MVGNHMFVAAAVTRGKPMLCSCMFSRAGMIADRRCRFAFARHSGGGSSPGLPLLYRFRPGIPENDDYGGPFGGWGFGIFGGQSPALSPLSLPFFFLKA
jgi:hypothetical protein